MHSKRFWYPLALRDRAARIYRVSFRIAEEATWDHRFHDLDGREIETQKLRLTDSDLRCLQAACDSAVGSRRPELRVATPG